VADASPEALPSTSPREAESQPGEASRSGGPEAGGARSVEAGGPGSIAIGRDAINSLLVTGGQNTFFIGRYERLSDAYIDPRALYRELEIERFTGRGWLVGEIDEFIRGHDRGYILLEAEAGMGKSSFLAWLARERGYAHHFVRLMADPNDVGTALRNLASQVIRAWDLQTSAPGGVLQPSTGRPDFFDSLLYEAADRRDELHPGEPIVIIVDGLNETVPPQGVNPLGLPAMLPPGVYVLASQRPVEVPLRVRVDRIVLTIDRAGDHNREDVAAYLEGVAGQPDMAALLEAAGVPSRRFVETLLERSGGVWIYLHYIVAEVRRGVRSPLALDELPATVWQYYAEFWLGWRRRHDDRWADADLPLLAILGAAAEALPATTIAELAGIDQVEDVEELLGDAWRPFVEMHDAVDATAYRVFHDSLREFLSGDGPLEDLTAAERSFAAQLERATRRAHGTIADRYLSAWGGLAAGLPDLEGTAAADMDGGYGLRHLVEHLDKAQRHTDMHDLLFLGRRTEGQPQNAWFAIHDGRGLLTAYRQDLTAALNAVRKSSEQPRVARQVRYVLLLASLASTAAAIPPTVLRALVRDGRMSPDEARAYARQIPAPEERAEALTGLIGVAPGGVRRAVEEDAIAALRSVPDGYWRVGELWRLRGEVSSELRDQVEATVESIREPYYRLVAERMLGRDDRTLSSPSLVGPGYEQDPSSPSGLAGSASFVDAYIARRAFAAALLRKANQELAEGEEPGEPIERYWRSHVAVDLEGASSGDGAERPAPKTGTHVPIIGDGHAWEIAWGAVAAALREVPGQDADGARVDPDQIRYASQRAAYLVHIAKPGEDPEMRQGQQRALDAIRALSSDQGRSGFIQRSAAGVARIGVAFSRDAAATIDDPDLRGDAILACAGQSEEAAATSLASDVLALIEQTPSVRRLSSWIVGVAPFLDDSGLARAEALATRIPDGGAKAAALLALGLRWCARGNHVEVERIRGSLDDARRPTLDRALAVGLVAAGDATRAIELARELPILWAAETCALAAAHLDGAAADSAIDAARTVASNADPLTRVAALAGAAARAPEPDRDGLIEGARTALADCDEADRSIGLLAIARSLASAHRRSDAIEESAKIAPEIVRAEALVALLDGDDSASKEALEQANGFLDGDARRRVLTNALRVALDTTPTAPGRSLPEALDAALPEFASLGRDQFLQELPAVTAALTRLELTDDVHSLANDLIAIQDWWP
jgi:hypothetical protein